MNSKKDVLFFGIHRPNRSPSQRYRIEQFLPFLETKQVSYDYDFLLNEKRDKIFYSKHHSLGKAYIVLYSIFKLAYVAFIKAKKYKVVFVQREMFMLGTSFFERVVSKKSRLVFDFDDAIWLANVSEANAKWKFLKNANKTNDIIKIADTIIAGNRFLVNHAKKYNSNVVLIPTCVDTNHYKTKQKKKVGKKVVIGWSGSQTTIEHFKGIVPVLEKLIKKHPNTIDVKVLGDGKYSEKSIGARGVKWKKSIEIDFLNTFDIGIMPLPMDEWSKGKCGLKALVYMSMKRPVVVQDVGVNKEIVVDGKNGYLAVTNEEWYNALEKLILNPSLWKKMGEEGRKMVCKSYSITSFEKKFYDVLGLK